MKKKLAALALALTILTVPAAAFSDVDEGLYYAAPIAWAVEKGITTGTSETTFSPDAVCTQGQILTFLWRAAGSPEAEVRPGSSEGEPLNPDFQKAIAWASQTGILNDDAAFAPSAPCGRGTAMRFLWRYIGAPSAETSRAFTDVAPDADYAQAVAWAVETGITSGTSETTFSPDELCTRGQIATFLYRCLNEAGEPVELPEDPAPSVSAVRETEEEIRPLRTYTGVGKAYSLGLDGSEFTSDGVYEAEVTVDVYSPYEAVFTIEVPFPLYQACSYSARFEDPDNPGKGYMFTYLRWDEAFADIIPWEGERQSYHFSNMAGERQDAVLAVSQREDDRIGGTVSWRLTLMKSGVFDFDALSRYQLGCEVNCAL